MTTNLVHRHVLRSYRSYRNLVQVNHNLHNHVFDDQYTNYSATTDSIPNAIENFQNPFPSIEIRTASSKRAPPQKKGRFHLDRQTKGQTDPNTGYMPNTINIGSSGPLTAEPLSKNWAHVHCTAPSYCQ